tara:strand:- start:599 stop:769 length:171 start_codon:yes stop_codon:yes gene_type:complete
MAGHKPNEKMMKKMGGGRIYANTGLYAKRKMKKHGGEVMKGSQPMYSEAMPKAEPN